MSRGSGTAAQGQGVIRQRGWPVLTTRLAGRPQRIAPDLDVDLLSTRRAASTRRTISGQQGCSLTFVLVRGGLLVDCKSVGLAFEGSNPSPATTSPIGPCPG